MLAFTGADGGRSVDLSAGKPMHGVGDEQRERDAEGEIGGAEVAARGEDSLILINSREPADVEPQLGGAADELNGGRSRCSAFF